MTIYTTRTQIKYKKKKKVLYTPIATDHAGQQQCGKHKLEKKIYNRDQGRYVCSNNCQSCTV